MMNDLDTTRQLVQRGLSSASMELERCIDSAQSTACAHAFTRTWFEPARQQAARPEVTRLPLAGLAVSIKDLFDIEGQPTLAGSVALADAPAAVEDAPVVSRLRSAGATLIGRSTMAEFAFSGVGTNPHYGTPAAYDGRFGALPGPARVPGGSSSGAAVSVAAGAAFVGLGSDTGGSLRIPAALNGIVGFKSTARLVPTAGAVPLSPTLDTVGAITRSVRDAVLVHEVLAARRVRHNPMPLSGWRLAVPETLFLQDLDRHVAAVFERTLHTLRRAGAKIDELRLPETAAVVQLQAGGGLPAAESYAWHRQLLQQRGAQYDPRIRSRIERGAHMLAADYLDILQARQRWIVQMQSQLAGVDALLSPTVPIVAPTLDSLAATDAAGDAEFFRVNALLLRNTSVVNLLDGCALSLPCHQQGEWPVGLMLWHAGQHDDAVLHVGLRVEEALAAAKS
ncbi:MAG: amidase [Giesbergeria sp.]|uniref:amidase n=1 Tax=Giesbergeria sp. TaxID=2818473 RepID=UPI00262DFB8D|nr:amidase [Giesbergeria sp.]MDD2609117.1 amidase [Giesbergeria sp.]